MSCTVQLAREKRERLPPPFTCTQPSFLREGNFAFRLTSKEIVPSKRASSKILNQLSKTMHSAASLRKKERLSPSPCMHTASMWGEGTFCLDREFSKNAQYKQKNIFHLASSVKI